MSSATDVVRVCAAGELGPGQLRLVSLPARGEGNRPQRVPRQAIVFRDEAGELHAYLNECQHIPIPLDAGSGQVWSRDRRYLMCATHGAIYEPTTGLCVAGPCAGRRLIRLRLEDRAGELYLRW